MSLSDVSVSGKSAEESADMTDLSNRMVAPNTQPRGNKPRKLPIDQTDKYTIEKDMRGDGEESEPPSPPECPVCLQICIHPVQLPCDHIFCFLCVKGAANQSKRCALCRREIPVDFFNKPTLIRKEDLVREMSVEDGHLWFYEGRNGWWQYDERTSKEIEEKYKKGEKTFDLLIAGFLYVLDLESMLQVRRNDPTRRRRIKRDAANTPKKGVAGLKIIPSESSSDREGAYGGDTTGSDGNGQNLPPVPTLGRLDTSSQAVSDDGTSRNTNTDEDHVTQMSSQMSALNLDSSTNMRRRRTSHPPSRR